MSCAVVPKMSMPQSSSVGCGYLRRDPTKIIKTLDMKIADLVKSHLMFAVREEVEVLKEQIKELMEKIGQLEYENGVLKANATQETLSKLNPPKQQPPSSSS